MSADSEIKKDSYRFADCMGYTGQITFTKPGWESTMFVLTSGLMTPTPIVRSDDNEIGLFSLRLPSSLPQAYRCFCSL
jgi:hypothetical protein